MNTFKQYLTKQQQNDFYIKFITTLTDKQKKEFLTYLNKLGIELEESFKNKLLSGLVGLLMATTSFTPTILPSNKGNPLLPNSHSTVNSAGKVGSFDDLPGMDQRYKENVYGNPKSSFVTYPIYNTNSNDFDNRKNEQKPYIKDFLNTSYDAKEYDQVMKIINDFIKTDLSQKEQNILNQKLKKYNMNISYFDTEKGKNLIMGGYDPNNKNITISTNNTEMLSPIIKHEMTHKMQFKSFPQNTTSKFYEIYLNNYHRTREEVGAHYHTILSFLKKNEIDTINAYLQFFNKNDRNELISSIMSNYQSNLKDPVVKFLKDYKRKMGNVK